MLNELGISLVTKSGMSPPQGSCGCRGPPHWEGDGPVPASEADQAIRGHHGLCPVPFR